MALWLKVLEIQGEAVKQIPIYSNTFPFEVRHCLANWIEEQSWESINPNNTQHMIYAQNLLQLFQQEISNTVADMANKGLHFMPLTYRLTSAAKIFQELYGDNPLEFVRTVQNCLQMEKNLIYESEKVGFLGDIMENDASVYRPNFDILRHLTYEADKLIEIVHQEQESFILSSQEYKKITAQLKHYANTYNVETNSMTPQPPNIIDHNNNDINAYSNSSVEFSKIRHEKDVLLGLLNSKNMEIKRQRMKLLEILSQTQNSLKELLYNIVNEDLLKWKIQQKLAGNGVPHHDNLNKTQKWFEQVADHAWKNRKQIKRFYNFQSQINLPEQEEFLSKLNANNNHIIISLVYDSFIIEKQPPQVLKTNTRFTSSVRLLVGTKLNLHMTAPEVQTFIISETQASHLHNEKEKAKIAIENIKSIVSGEILNHHGVMEYDPSLDILSVNFKNMQLKKIKRQEKRSTETVAEEKFCLLYKSSFKIAGGDLTFNVWTLSLPVVVIVHGNQEANAWASILWDNAFSDFHREPFKVWSEVPWIKMAEMLNYKFQSMVGLGLTAQNIQYLKSKIMSVVNSQDSENITMSQFNKEHLQNRPFTFWQWFYYICILVRDHLKAHWIDRSIMGFVSRTDAHDMLMRKCRHTFLIRFSDSVLGGVTIAWVDENTALGPDKVDVWNLRPFTSKDFAIRSLSDRIKDLDHLQFLYPDIPKDTAFGNYYSASEGGPAILKDGYVGTVLITTTALPIDKSTNLIPSSHHHEVQNNSHNSSTEKSSPPSFNQSMNEEISNVPFEELWSSGGADDFLTSIESESLNFLNNPNLMDDIDICTSTH